MKTENWLLIAVIILSLFLGGLIDRVFWLPKTISVINTSVFVSPPDSTRPKPLIGKPDRVLPKVSKPDTVLKPQQTNTVKPQQGQTVKPIDNTPKQEIESFKTFSDSLGTYYIKALADCAVKEFELQVTHKPFTQTMQECSQTTTFVYGGLVGIIVTLIAEIIFYLVLK